MIVAYEHPDKAQLAEILDAVKEEYPELAFFPKTILDVTVRMWYEATKYGVGRDRFVADMTGPVGVVAIGYISYVALHKRPAP